MKKLIHNLVLLALVIGLSAITVYWIEADKEIEVLCSLFEEGKSLEQVTKILETGNLLSYHLDGRMLSVQSSYNLFSSKCSVEFSEADVTLNSSLAHSFNLPKTFAGIGLLLSVLLMIFQFLLALGYPLGRYAWGGDHEVLPRNLRIGSFFSMLIFCFSAFLILIDLLGKTSFPVIYPVLGVIFLLSTFANLNSTSTRERRIMTPIAFLLFLCYLSLAML